VLERSSRSVLAASRLSRSREVLRSCEVVDERPVESEFWVEAFLSFEFD
jgi:hypothetical protein